MVERAAAPSTRSGEPQGSPSIRSGPLSSRRARWAAAGALAIGTALLFARVRTFPFIHFDDTRYVTENPVVQGGLSWNGLVWAFTTFHVSNWHPLTWLSHMLDVQLFGVEPGSHHLVNVLFHSANAALLFLVLTRLTGAPARSALVAALFAVHPLHVESVAWVAERKDVLSTFFGLLALGAWRSYAERPSAGRYLLVALWFSLSLLAKPMWVTFPFLLLLLDWWPLARVAAAAPGQGVPAPGRTVPVGRLMAEKLPLVALSAASCVVTVLAQARGGALRGLELGLGARFLNAALAYAGYVGKAFWPSSLAVYYPHPGNDVPVGLAVAALLALAVATALALLAARKRPWWPVGWLWFLGTLVPVIGIVQVGGQSMADRYTYLPLVGLFVAMVWEGHRLLASSRRGLAVALGAAMTAVVAFTVTTWHQLGYWTDHETLFKHALAVTRDNALAHGTLSEGLLFAGKQEEALFHAREAVRLRPSSARHWNNLAMTHRAMGMLRDARAALLEATRLDPQYPTAWSNLGLVSQEVGELREAEAALQRSEQLDPWSAQVRFRMGALHEKLREVDGAIEDYREAVRLQPDYAAAWNNLAILYERTGRSALAGEAFTALTRVQPSNPVAWRNLGVHLAKAGQLAEAARSFREALRLKPGDPELTERLQVVERGVAGTGGR